jgi:UDP-N-acetylmuramoyl-tripeptide--D-alanyl-D-alanine ligase
MSFWTSDHFEVVLRGEWLAPPRQSIPLAGVGIDSRSDVAGRAFIAIRGDRHDGHDFLAHAARAGAAIAIVDRPPGALPANLPVLRVPDTRRALIDLARGWRARLTRTTIIAITGSAGKTTTKSLLHHVLGSQWHGCCSPKSFNNDIGVPLTLLDIRGDHDHAVVEVGTNAPGEIDALAAIVQPDIAVITSIGRSHLERLGTVAQVACEKAALLHHLTPSGRAFVNTDRPELADFLDRAPRLTRYGRHADAHLRLTARGALATSVIPAPPVAGIHSSASAPAQWLEVNGSSRFRLALPGEHNAVNALAVIGIAREMGMDDAAIDAALAAADAPHMRFARSTINGVAIFNDAYNANPDSMAASLRTFIELTAGEVGRCSASSGGAAGRRFLILGDMLELGPHAPALHEELGSLLDALDVAAPLDEIIFIGSHGDDFRRGARSCRDRITLAADAHSPVIDSLLTRLREGDALFLKGSRRLGLERIADRAGSIIRDHVAAR